MANNKETNLREGRVIVPTNILIDDADCVIIMSEERIVFFFVNVIKHNMINTKEILSNMMRMMMMMSTAERMKLLIMTIAMMALLVWR